MKGYKKLMMKENNNFLQIKISLFDNEEMDLQNCLENFVHHEDFFTNETVIKWYSYFQIGKIISFIGKNKSYHFNFSHLNKNKEMLFCVTKLNSILTEDTFIGGTTDEESIIQIYWLLVGAEKLALKLNKSNNIENIDKIKKSSLFIDNTLQKYLTAFANEDKALLKQTKTTISKSISNEFYNNIKYKLYT